MNSRKYDTGQLASQLERLPTVKRRTGLSRSEIYRQIKVGTFPRPVKLGLRSSAWVSTEITTWIDQRIEKRGTSNA